jgi:PRC-barrel domain
MRLPLLAAAMAALSLLAVPAFAQGAPQSVQIAKIDVIQKASGYRASKYIGSTVVNDANDTVGKVDDVIMSADGKSIFVVLSVGGFLGVGSKLVAVPYASLQIGAKDVVLPGGNKDQLKALPEFKYATS